MWADVYFWRQIFIFTAPLCFSVSIGLLVSYPGVLNSAILSNSSDIRTTSSEASWIASSQGFAGILGFFIIPPMMQILGRRTVNISSSAFHLIGWIILPFAKGTDLLYTARIIQGLSLGGFYINYMVMSEYCDPKLRGSFAVTKKIVTYLGTLCCHAMALRWNWRIISCFATIPSFLGVVLTFFWPESPSHYAMQGRYEECKESYKWIFGESPGVQKELNLLISSQMERRKDKPVKKNYCMMLLKKFTRKDFLRSFVILSLITMVIDLSGRFFFVAYVIDIMVELLEDKSLALYCSIGADCLIILALIVSLFIIRVLERRTLLFTFGGASVLIMLFFSTIVFLKIHYNLFNYAWLTPCIILFHSFVVNAGLIPVSYTLIGEVFPLEHKGLGSSAAGVVFCTFYAVTIKLTPVLMEVVGSHGTYAIYGISSGVCLILLYFIVPETKDRTLTEIEREIKGTNEAIEHNTSKEIENLL